MIRAGKHLHGRVCFTVANLEEEEGVVLFSEHPLINLYHLKTCRFAALYFKAQRLCSYFVTK